MKILVLGGDGYLGWPTAMHFSRKGHEVAVADNFVKRQWELKMGVEPLLPVHPLHRRVKAWKEAAGKEIKLYVGDLRNHRFVYAMLHEFHPDAIVHYGEQPSAPFSMVGVTTATETQVNNVVGTLNILFGMKRECPQAHLIKLGTMGEYGTPNIDIEEGWLTLTHNGRTDTVLYPKRPGSFYHLSKVHDSHNIEFACRVWGLRATDLNQGVVYGISTPETELHPELGTSFHYDETFGTALNRFCVQAAAGTPLTVYGTGGQTRGYLNIVDTLQCVELSALNPAKEGEFRVFNQFTEIFTVRELAEQVKTAALKLGVNAVIESVPNPRVEAEEHYYNPIHTKLPSLGLKPHMLSDVLITDVLAKTVAHKDRILRDTILPRTKWRQV